VLIGRGVRWAKAGLNFVRLCPLSQLLANDGTARAAGDGIQPDRKDRSLRHSTSCVAP